MKYLFFKYPILFLKLPLFYSTCKTVVLQSKQLNAETGSWTHNVFPNTPSLSTVSEKQYEYILI